MYETFFGMDHRPFAPTPNPKCYLETESLRTVADKLHRCVNGGEGLALVTAGAGMGKTLFCQKQAEWFRQGFGEKGEAGYAVVFLANSNFTTTAGLLQAILYELDQPYLRMEEQELRLQLITTAKSLRPMKKGVLLIVDEAHRIPSPLLEEIRTITNLTDQGEPLVRVILCGQIELEEKLAEPELAQLNQRVSCQLMLEPFNLFESANYIDYRLRQVNSSIETVFTEAALDLICRACDGIPRYLNQLCDHSLLLAYIADISPVTVELVQEALNDLKQLPLNWNLSALPATSDHEPSEDQAAVEEDLINEEEALTMNSEPSEDVAQAAEQPGKVPTTSVQKVVFEVGAEPEPASARKAERVAECEEELCEQDCSSGLVESLMEQEACCKPHEECCHSTPCANTAETRTERTAEGESAQPCEEWVQDRYVHLAMGRDVSSMKAEPPKPGMPAEADPQALTIGHLEKSHLAPSVQPLQRVVQPWGPSQPEDEIERSEVSTPAAEIVEEQPREIVEEQPVEMIEEVVAEQPVEMIEEVVAEHPVEMIEDMGAEEELLEEVEEFRQWSEPVAVDDEEDSAEEAVASAGVEAEDIAEDAELLEEITEELRHMQIEEEQLQEAVELEPMIDSNLAAGMESAEDVEEASSLMGHEVSLEEHLQETVLQMLEETQAALRETSSTPLNRETVLPARNASRPPESPAAANNPPAAVPSKPRRRYAQLFSMLRRREFGQ